MADPYEVLNLAPQTGPEQVRQRYLEMVRRFPPERHPQRFAEIQAAYEQLRDPVRRLQDMLFHPDQGETLDDLIRRAAKRLRNRRLPLDVLLNLDDRLRAKGQG